ncbi:hypothetical protein F8M41_016124 [Gigaspora margarita]|uniref:Uncharacterized protein n=1 Tax=Gigaspora margarita TaxID=4874 RepID=A0A8H3ZZX8_GIGMA|nr:hypothetical protein F8M41_016124 [Gigaspora margarita]
MEFKRMQNFLVKLRLGYGQGWQWIYSIEKLPIERMEPNGANGANGAQWSQWNQWSQWSPMEPMELMEPIDPMVIFISVYQQIDQQEIKIDRILNLQYQIQTFTPD